MATRIIIKEGIQLNGTQVCKLMDPKNEHIIKAKIENAIKDILDGTEYDRIKGNPPTFGVEKET